MQKITTLAMALLAMGSLATSAWAQVVSFTPTSNIESGWYQIRQVKGVNKTTVTETTPSYLFCSEKLTPNNNYTWVGTATTQKADATAFLWVDKGTADYSIQSIDGRWTNSKGQVKPNRNGFQIKTKDATKQTFTIGDYWDDWKNFNGYMGASMNSKEAAFQFSKVSDADLNKYDIYSISIKSATADITLTTDLSLTCNIANNKGTKTIYNGGHLFLTSGTTVTNNNLVPATYAGCSASVQVDATAKNITVTYALDETLISKAKAYLAETGIGTPIASAALRTTLQTAISNAEKTKNFANYSALVTATENYLNSDKDIQMPEDGKAYTFTMVTKAGKKFYMDYNVSGYTLQATSAENNKNYPQTATLICHKLANGNYVFLNNAGKYLIFKGVNNASEYNNNKGYSDNYETVNIPNTTTTLYPQQVTIKKLGKGSYSETPNGLYVYAMSNRYTNNNKKGVFVIDKNGAYSAAQDNPFFNDNHSSAIKIEEVTYPNHVTFNATSEDIKDVKNIATFSAPFATIVPEGVTAWYVDGENGEKATLKAVEYGKAIPANQGVLLTSETGTAVTMVPVADEAVTTISGNKLKASAGAEKTLTDADNAYILGKSAAGKVAFFKGKIGSKLGMNKAYLEHAAGAAAIALDFNLGTTTGIQNAVVSEQSNAPIYDLSGRRVQNTMKGGFYIQGGKKFIAQ